MTYSTISAYVGSKSRARERIEAIELLIDSMMLRITEVAEGTASTVDEYELNDGQVKIRTKYRSIEDVEKGIKSLLTLKHYYINKYNGRQTVLRDVRGLH
ncbi:hypothetical protein [Flagellimonas nanhaiensis]|uniref:Uncharacterized protein n=1 Tax=Flagellimonas nanhaiensis TaxID=2292706 RepID=A0A371JL84_9FLAO|nr:hypothetical protein [Allomuricauda nanhaiensis]RDY57722.1 hypothetical protein DX873_17645 [Allomuricauda nanhaiensis]